MKKIFKIYLLPAIMLLTVSSCKKSFEDLTLNNNVPNSVPASLLFNGVVNSMVDLPQGSAEIYDQYYIYNYNYYGNNTYDLGSGDNYYNTLKNVTVMEKQAIGQGLPAVNGYSALGKFFRAYFFSKMSLEEGDIPMSQALQGLANLTPKYDSQKDVMKQALAWLESANTDLGALIAGGTTSIQGDIFFNGDLAKWQKVVNAFHIRLLTELSKKAVSDADLNVPAQFAAIVSNPTKYPLMTSAADNLQYIFVAPSNYYPQNPDNFGQNGSRQNSSQTYIKLLTTFHDPRVFVTAEPARDLVDVKKQSPTDFASFVGADPGLDLGTMYNNAGLGYYSFINRKHFYSTYTGEPSIQIGYAEQEFNIAEGINRGWATGDAESFYVKGIQASMDSYSIPATGSFTAYFYRPGSSSVSSLSNYDTYTIKTDWATYYGQPAVKYTPGATGLTQILQQKYLALFRHSGLESYFTYRRTGVPNFTTGPGTSNGQRIALRFQYPSSERTANSANYNAALSSQFGGNDDINGVMWILK
ncbi:MAG: SusD/RagB family nutrient-binding outer membrane lipoprotein [Mucilaginibacter sp.]|uniref:SusD/RagB family nutrient-binding outer membrane lipoprotein n=1 Tax=Mucilaginibacter sp. L3T2-6 TaxID=3062491 RepID=UPI002674797A|nr:SusD/RagB family nutrient-binding outer membrane lipoprotein [Mucilaginibacter sp. L3T2-6]MDO3642141.1 SusD/RagB family nutrient-binding outer membrane lipoprotein [Mucilaginibacter sp. L3T2-6]MDV6214635.1 SusD/RagB family nutrient-binding outer membrane lipoprotein [Mucilaginibacter sp. L3T2-6]